MSKAKEGLDRIRDLPDDELVQAHDRAREELFRLRLGNYTNQVENTISLRLKRREVARILTIQRARELTLEGQASGESSAAADEADEPQTVADRARAAVGRPKTTAKTKPAATKPAATKAATKKPAAKTATKAKAGAKSSKKSGKE
jgi:large subunit ribosomal protein L29